MPKRSDIESILIIGAGPIVIGQACEFDYSGAQACKALREEGYRVILVNSNPATIMTDPAMADATYIEPITWETVEKIIEKEKPDAILPTMGGQTALNCALDLHDNGVLEKHGVELIGANQEAIHKAEDRNLFDKAMKKIGLECARAEIVHTLVDAMEVPKKFGFPVIIRPSFTMGGSGGGIAYNWDEFEEICLRGLDLSPTNELLIDESLLGWKEYEMEVVRDKNDNCIIICSIENFDPMGVHTGDSITVAPAQTLTDKEMQIMRNASIAVLREIGVETGGSNVQFAVNPEDGRLVVIEMNPRVSRSSALASKATGFPIAKVAAKLAVGYTLDELKNDITGGATPASFEPSIDYVVTKVPRFTFEKFGDADARLTTQMKSVGEVMAIGRTFQESLQKALRGLEVGSAGFEPKVDLTDSDALGLIRRDLSIPGAERIWYVADAFRAGMSLDEVFEQSKIDRWFLVQIEDLINSEKALSAMPLSDIDRDIMFLLKRKGFSDKRLSDLLCVSEKTLRNHRHQLGVFPVYKRVDTCAAEFSTSTAYMYSTYEEECESEPSGRDKIMVIGGGPNRIGQGIEFDYCCVHAALAARDDGYETIMVNCNPETVSTDYDTSDRLYFEPVTLEDVLEIVRKEKPKGVIVQFGGQTPLKLANELEAEGAPIIGTSPEAIDRAEDRERFQQMIERLGLLQPPNAICRSTQEALAVAPEVRYPLVVRPSYVLGGRAMEIVHDREGLDRYIAEAVQVSGDSPVLIDSFLKDAIEVDVDTLSDGLNIHVAGIMEHIEEAGIHSGDSACSLPPYSLPIGLVNEVKRQSRALAKALNVVGLMNVQFAVKDDEVYLIEVNPRASRTVPFVAKAIGSPIAALAARAMAGEKLTDFDLADPITEHVAVKEVVIPWARFPGVDVLLGPEMKSTGEVMGIDKTFPMAFYKSQLAAGVKLPEEGKVFISVKDSDKYALVPMVRNLLEMGYGVIATSGTADYLASNNLEVERVYKVNEGARPHVLDIMKNGDVKLMFNTTEGKQAIQDSYELRHTALTMKLPYYTTIAASRASVKALKALKAGELNVKKIQDFN